MQISLLSLPTELIGTILAHLPISSLLAFSITCRTSRSLAEDAHQILNLAVFPRQVHGELAFLPDSSNTSSSLCNVLRTANPHVSDGAKIRNPAALLRQQIVAQNKVASEILGLNVNQNLKILSIHMYDIQLLELTSAIAKLTKLRELNLRFCHLYIHDRSFPANYWREAPNGNPCWNAVVGLGPGHKSRLQLRSLQVLRIDRAGLTSAQLRKFIISNPGLKVLHLSNVTGVDLEFVEWLATSCQSGETRLEELALEACPQLKIQKLGDFTWLAGIVNSNVRRLSLRKCTNVRNKLLFEFLEDDREGMALQSMEIFVPPKGPLWHYGIEQKLVTRSGPIFVPAEVNTIEDFIAKQDQIDVDPEFISWPVSVN